MKSVSGVWRIESNCLINAEIVEMSFVSYYLRIGSWVIVNYDDKDDYDDY